MAGDRMIEDTSGFYKYESEQLLYAPNFVYGPDFTLLREEVDSYLSDDSLPIYDWYYFDSEEAARLYFQLPEAEPEPEEDAVPLSGGRRPRA
jgi:hypothetical protein